MKLTISREALRNMIIDFRKKEVCPRERASIIKQYRKAKGMSQRQLAKELNTPHSTVRDWELWNKITQPELDKAISDGYTMTDVYKHLRENQPLVRIDRSQHRIDRILMRSKRELNYFINHQSFSTRTEEHVKELINLLNRLLMRIEK